MRLDGHPLAGLLDMPPNLLVLNVSSCQLSALDPIADSCVELRLLNASFNAIRSLVCLVVLPNLTELYLENNEITTLNECAEFPKLCILDASANPLSNYEDLAQLATSPCLRFLRLKETLLSTLPEFPGRMRELLPQILTTDGNPQLLGRHSAYAKIASFALGLAPAGSTLREVQGSYSALPERKSRVPPATSESADWGNRTGEGKGSMRRDISSIIETVSAKKFTVVSQRNITDSVSRSGAFGNPIAAMMIGPATVAKKKNSYRRSIPGSVPSSTKRTPFEW